MSRNFAYLVSTLLLCMAAIHPSARAADDVRCTIIVDAGSGDTVHRDGVCDRRYSPASTFKVPLAVMGYDAGILDDEDTPAWDYKAEYDAPERDRKTVDPTVWERDSVLWFSREITRRLGSEKFAAYVAGFDYGNADVSGNRDKKNGLTRSWVDSSLKITPVEQVEFLRRLLDRKLPVSANAHDMTVAILPAFEAGGWVVKGKTGSTRVRAEGEGRALGWFVGWAERDGRRVVFTRLAVNDRKEGPKGLATRAAFLADLPSLLK